MPFWLTLLLFVGSIIISEALRPKPQFTNAKPAGLGDFTFPTATAGRPIPVIWGTAKLLAPNVIWYGNLQTVPIVEIVKYKKMFKTKKKRVVKGHRYFIDMHMALCHGPIDAIPNVFVQDRSAFGIGTIPAGGGGASVSLPDFFGGEDKGGGLSGQVLAFQGNETQAVNATIDAKINQPPTPAFRRVANVFLNNFEIGNDEFVDPFNFVVRRIPTGLGSTTPSIVNDQGNTDANPAEVIFEMLTEHTWGAGMSPGLIDTVSFLAAADTLATEGFGISLIWDAKSSIEDRILDVIQQIDGVLFNDLVTGLFTLNLIRDDLVIPSLPVLNQSNIISLDSFARGALDETVNEVKVVYTGESFMPHTAQAHELANFKMQDQNLVSSTFQYPGINDSLRAADVAFRELRTLSFPLARIRIKANRESFDLRPGDAFKFTWPPLGITDLVMRVNGVQYGTLDQGFIGIDATQDIFTLGNTIWAEPQPTDWVEPVSAPEAAAFEDVFSAPFHTVREEFTDFNFSGEEANMVATVASPGNEDTLGYQILTRDPPDPFSLTGDTDHMTPNGTILTEYTATNATGDVDNTNSLIVTDESRMFTLTPAAEIDILNGSFNLMFVGDVDLQAGEIMSFESITDNLDGTFTLDGVHRGLMDTTPKTHAAGTRIWFAFFGLGTSEIEFANLQSIELKYLPRTLAGTLAEGSAAALPHTFTNRTQRPYPPADFTVETEIFPVAIDGDLVESSILELAWAHRNRQESLLRNQGDPNVGPEADVDYQLRIHDENDALIRTEDFSPGSATTSFDYECLVEAADSSIAVDVINNIALRWPDTGTVMGVNLPEGTVLNSAVAGYDEKTIEVKMRTGADITSRQIIWEQGDEQDGINLYIDAGGVRAGVWSDAATTVFSEFTNPEPILANTKYNFAFVFDNPNSRIRLYVNGILVDDRTGLTLDTLPDHSGGTTHQPKIGFRNETRYHDGNSIGQGDRLDDAALVFEARQWNAARTTTEIDTNQNANLVGNEAGLVGLWEMSDGSGTTVTDETVNANDGTLVGTPIPLWVCVDLVLNETLRLELDSRFLASGLLSHQFQERLVVRAGWGYGYGDNYGGAP